MTDCTVVRFVRGLSEVTIDSRNLSRSRETPSQLLKKTVLSHSTVLGVWLPM